MAMLDCQKDTTTNSPAPPVEDTDITSPSTETTPTTTESTTTADIEPETDQTTTGAFNSKDNRFEEDSRDSYLNNYDSFVEKGIKRACDL